MRRSIRPLSVGVAVAAMVISSLAAGPPAASADAPATVTVTDPTSGAVSGCAVSGPNTTYASRVALSSGHAQIWRLYQAFFLRQPDLDGFHYWLGVRAGGVSLGHIAYTFAQGPEFGATYGQLTDEQFVDLAYTNVLCRSPEADGRAYWAAELGSGRLTRWDLMVNFVELREYLARTGTCHSIYPAESAAVAGCPGAGLAPLDQADLGPDGYRQVTITVPRWGGGSGTFRGVEVDIARGRFETGTQRCSVASINANWLVASQKDGPDPGVLGVGVVDGIHVKNSADRSDRGVFGLRFDETPTDVVEVWPGDTLSADDTRLSSVAWQNGTASLENWHAAAELSPYLSLLAPAEIVDPGEWVWAAAGVPLRVDGQTDGDFLADYVNDPYTYQTLRHPYVAVDQDTGRLLFGATADSDVRDMVVWAESNGYEDLIKFDGGASAEFNVGGQAVVAGTSRHIPVWLGLGC